MSQTSDVVWIEGPPGDSAVTAWGALTYKVGDASGDFSKPVFTIEYGNHRHNQACLAESYASGGLMINPWDWAPGAGVDSSTLQAAARLSRFVAGNASRFLFIDRRRISDIALPFSIPTLFWRRFSSLARGSQFAPSGLQYYSYFSGEHILIHSTLQVALPCARCTHTSHITGIIYVCIAVSCVWMTC